MFIQTLGIWWDFSICDKKQTCNIILIKNNLARFCLLQDFAEHAQNSLQLDLPGLKVHLKFLGFSFLLRVSKKWN